MATSGRTLPTATTGVRICAEAMAGVASSAMAQAPAAINRRRTLIDDTDGVPDWVYLARKRYSG
jgi:hypothetical protein